MNIIEQLQELGLVAQLSAHEELVSHLGSAVRTVYCGFDPTADSLHIGNLVPLLALVGLGYDVLLDVLPRVSRGYWVQINQGIFPEELLSDVATEFIGVSVTETGCMN